jgi:hypothetical protein
VQALVEAGSNQPSAGADFKEGFQKTISQVTALARAQAAPASGLAYGYVLLGFVV